MMKSKTKKDLTSQLQPCIEQFLAGLGHLKTKSRQEYRETIRLFIIYLDRSPARKSFPTTLKQKTIVQWLKQMRKRYSLCTVLTSVRRVARFLSFLEHKGMLQQNALSHLQKKYPRKGLTGIVWALMSSSPKKSLQTLKLPAPFTSPLGPHMQKFIALGRSQGKLYLTDEKRLCRFDRLLRSYSDPPLRLSDPILRQWLSLFSLCRPETRYKNFMAIRRFCLYLRRFDPKAYMPDTSLSPPLPPPFLPYIYSRAEIVALLKAAHELKPSAWSPLRPQIFYLMISLLYTTGMRLGEALKLQLVDVDRKNQALHIRETKFFKSRLVPLSPSMMEEMEEYLKLRRRSGAPTTAESPLFQSPRREGPYSISVIQKQFRHMLRNLGLKPNRGRSGPRVHDLRATFAVHRLENWYRQGVDVQSKLGLLSTYLGHVGIASTQRYLPMTTELFKQASQRFNEYVTSTQIKKEEKDER